jgi:hypothetical protein
MTFLAGALSIWVCSAFAQIGAPPTAPSAQPPTADDYFRRGIAKGPTMDLNQNAMDQLEVARGKLFAMLPVDSFSFSGRIFGSDSTTAKLPKRDS